MNTKIKFTVEAPGQEPFVGEVDAEEAQLWMEEMGIRSIPEAGAYLLTPVVTRGKALKAAREAQEQLDALMGG